MDSGGPFTPHDDTLPQIRDLPQLSSLRIAPLRQPVSSRILNVPSPLEPNASSGIRETSLPKTTNSSSGTSPAKLPTLEEFLNAARTNTHVGHPLDPIPSLEPPPKTILPAFINLRTVEKLPYSSFDEDVPRKRRRVDVQGELFGENLQLPIPHAQNEKKPPPFGPFTILNGLNEPPPNAALFPPIELGSIQQILTKPTKDTPPSESAPSSTSRHTQKEHGERREGRIEEILDSRIEDKNEDQARERDKSTVTEKGANREGSNQSGEKGSKEAASDASQKPAEESDEPMSPKTRGRSRKKVRKWTEQETADLLRGVVKCGIGNWTAILAQPELKFNKRTAANLKDRFRVCCPWAYGAADPNEATKQLRISLANALMKAESDGSNGTAGKILLPDPRSSQPGVDSSSSTASPAVNSNAEGSSSGPSSAAESDSARPRQNSRYPPTFKVTPSLSNKAKSTLESLGIPEPYFTIKSKRRSRRPFTPAEDEALLKGYAVHGFQWTRIQKDKRLNLGHRRATDLRDRFRTKFPHAYREGGSVSLKILTATLGKQNQQATIRPQQPQPPLPLNADSYQKQKGNDNPCPPLPPPPPMLGPIDPVLLPPAPPPGLLDSFSSSSSSAAGASSNQGMFPFPLDESSSATAGANADTSTPWEDNTLPPLVWDDLS
ncbi:MYB DNA-binding domain protein [Thermoascus aurantiacus ATCC 26904]